MEFHAFQVLVLIILVTRVQSRSDVNDYCQNCTDWCSTLDHKPVYTMYSDTREDDTTILSASHHPLKMDTASLTIVSECSNPLTLKIRSSECYNCSYSSLADLAPNSSVHVTVETMYYSELTVLLQTDSNLTVICHNDIKFSQYGNYTFNISPNTSVGEVSDYFECIMTELDSPEDVNVPVYAMISVIVLVAVLWSLLKFLDRICDISRRILQSSRSRLVNDDLGAVSRLNTDSTNSNQDITQANNLAPVKVRLLSLDTFRGLSVTLMIFVNYGGGKYWYFKHAAWNGLHVADLVFPWFIFIMGTSMVFSLRSQVRHNATRTSIFVKILKRSIILIAIGLILNSAPRCPDKVTHFENFRIPGVLQRIGVTYFFTSVIHLTFSYEVDSDKPCFIVEWIVHLVMLTVYLFLTFLLPVPGCPTAYLGPGGLADDGAYPNCTGGAAGYIDRIVFGTNHIYNHPTSHRVYGGSVAFDPEGLLGCLTSIFLCFLGIQAGKIFHNRNWKSVVLRQSVFCLICSAVGILLCQARKEGGWVPINKNLWSLSFILCIAGTSFFLLTVFYLIVDSYKIWSGAPFLFVGMNPFLMYILHEVFHFYLPINFHVHEDHWSELALDCWGTVFWVFVAYVLHRKKIYLVI